MVLVYNSGLSLPMLKNFRIYVENTVEAL